METLEINLEEAKKEAEESVKEAEEIKVRDDAFKEFRLSPVYTYIIKSVEEKIKDVTDTRILAKNFGAIKNDVIGDIGVLGVASLMASSPLEELLEELEGDL